MDFRFTAEQVQLRKAARDFAEQEIKPIADEVDASNDFPAELIKRVAFLRGLIDNPLEKKNEKSAEEELAEFVLAQKQKEAQ